MSLALLTLMTPQGHIARHAWPITPEPGDTGLYLIKPTGPIASAELKMLQVSCPAKLAVRV